MGKKVHTVMALELGIDSLRFVEMARDERRVIAVGAFPLASGQGRGAAYPELDALEASVRAALGAARGTPQAVMVSVALGEAWLRLLDAPDDADGADDESAVRDYAEWDMSRYLGCSREDVAQDLVLDVIEGPEGPFQARRVIVAAFPRAAALAVRATVERAAGLPLAALDVDAAAVVNAFVANYPELSAERTILVQAHAAATALVRVQQGRFQGAVVRRDGEALSPAGHDDAQQRAEGYLHRVRGIVSSLQAGTDGWDEPAHVLLCGELARDADFRELLRAHLPVPFSLLNPFRNIAGPDPVDYSDAYPGAALAAPVGLAWRLAEDAS